MFGLAHRSVNRTTLFRKGGVMYFRILVPLDGFLFLCPAESGADRNSFLKALARYPAGSCRTTSISFIINRPLNGGHYGPGRFFEEGFPEGHGRCGNRAATTQFSRRGEGRSRYRQTRSRLYSERGFEYDKRNKSGIEYGRDYD